jgi:hypothetical protein
MTEKEDKERITRLEETVKHLISLWLDSREYDDLDSKITMEEFYKKEQEHKTVFQKFLHWVDKKIEYETATQGKPEDA